jgi:hypothetical protein
VALVRTDVSEEPSASFIRVTRISELGTTLQLATDERCEEIPSLLQLNTFLEVKEKFAEDFLLLTQTP